MTINKQKLVVECGGQMNEITRIARALGFRLESQRGLSSRSDVYSGYASMYDCKGREWHIVG